jgi:hypothetical protein
MHGKRGGGGRRKKIITETTDSTAPESPTSRDEQQ